MIENEKKLSETTEQINKNEEIINAIIKEELEKEKGNSKCDKCLSDNEELTFSFSCTHNICITCMFNFFISNKFKGLNLDYISLNCPQCKFGYAKFSMEIWINLLNQIYFKQNNNKDTDNTNTAHTCKIHKDEQIIKYCNKCKKYLCEICLKSNHINMHNHRLIDKEKMPYCLPYDNLTNINSKYKEFQDNLTKIENLFYDKIENEYILKKTKIEDLIRKLNLFLSDYIVQMNLFQKSMENIFYILNISYYNYYFNNANNENNKDILISNELVDVKFISKNTTDISDLINYFYKKLLELNNKIKIEQNKEKKDQNIFDYELIWSDLEPKKKIILKESKDDKEKLDSITKILELKKSEGLATCQINGVLNIWEINEKKICFRFKGHNSAIWSLMETSDGYLVSGSSDKTIKIWDCVNRKENCIATLKGHKGTIYCIAEIDNNKIISGSEDSTLKIWDIQKSKMQCVLTLNDPNKSKINSIIVLKETSFVLTGNDDNLIKIWNINDDSGFVTNYLEGHSCTVWCLVVFSDDELLASGSSDNLVKIWDLVNLKLLYSLEGHENTISSIIVLRNELLASSSWDNTCKIWNLNARNCLYTLVGHKDIVWGIIELQNGDIATCSNDKSIIIWEK